MHLQRVTFSARDLKKLDKNTRGFFAASMLALDELTFFARMLIAAKNSRTKSNPSATLSQSQEGIVFRHFAAKICEYSRRLEKFTRVSARKPDAISIAATEYRHKLKILESEKEGLYFDCCAKIRDETAFHHDFEKLGLSLSHLEDSDTLTYLAASETGQSCSDFSSTFTWLHAFKIGMEVDPDFIDNFHEWCIRMAGEQIRSIQKIVIAAIENELPNSKLHEFEMAPEEEYTATVSEFRLPLFFRKEP